jgi:hypothetical protein
MKSTIVSTLIIFFLFSCVHPPEKEKINVFILYGHSGFCFIDSAKWIFDSTKFDIREYFEFTKDSAVKIAHRRYRENPVFYITNFQDTVGLSSVMNDLISLNLNDTTFYAPNLEIYDGRYYTMHFITSKFRHIKINYVPHHLPDKLKKIHDTIIRIIYSDNNQQVEPFSFNNLLINDALETYRITPPPPAPTPLKKINSTRPVNIKDSN